MPTMQTALGSMNQSFAAGSIGEIPSDVVEEFRPGPDTSFVSALRRLPGLDMSDAVFDYLEEWPTALQRSVQAVIWENLTRGAVVPITFAWTPSYDYSVTIFDVRDTDKTAGGITVLFTSRYPADAHPLAARGS